ncbi:hypothetical protein A4Q89_15380, partial [Listeria monocytogenes]
MRIVFNEMRSKMKNTKGKKITIIISIIILILVIATFSGYY